MAKLTLQELESTLWQCADILRGELTGAEYKDYIFGMLFLKRLNDEFDEEREARKKEFLEDGLEENEIEVLSELIGRCLYQLLENQTDDNSEAFEKYLVALGVLEGWKTKEDKEKEAFL